VFVFRPHKFERFDHAPPVPAPDARRFVELVLVRTRTLNRRRGIPKGSEL